MRKDVIDAEFEVISEGRRVQPAPRPKFIDWRNALWILAFTALAALKVLLLPEAG